MKTLALFLAANALAVPLIRILTADLKPQALAAFDRYAGAREKDLASDESSPARFLEFDSLPAAERDGTVSSLRQGQIFIRQLAAGQASPHAIAAPGGLIHDWLGVVFVPRASLRQVLTVLQDYNHHARYYRPEVVRSRLLARQNDDFRVYMRLRERKIITVTLDTEHEIQYRQVDAARWSSRSRATRIQEVGDAGTPEEHLLPVGHDGGFLWQINTYWRLEERRGGVFVQCESLSLTRDIPAGLGWLIEPFLSSVPRESLAQTLEQTRRAVLETFHLTAGCSRVFSGDSCRAYAPASAGRRSVSAECHAAE